MTFERGSAGYDPVKLNDVFRTRQQITKEAKTKIEVLPYDNRASNLIGLEDRRNEVPQPIDLSFRADCQLFCLSKYEKHPLLASRLRIEVLRRSRCGARTEKAGQVIWK